jgi:DNA polymerase
MQNRVHIDFETRSQCDLLATGSWVYSAHPSTEILCIAYAIGDQPVQLWSPFFFDDEEGLQPLFDAIQAGCEIMAHNAFFERCIWENIGVLRNNWPQIEPRQWRCTAAKAAVHALPRSLAQCAEVLGLSQRKDEAGKRIMMKLSKPRKFTIRDKSMYHGKSEDFDVLFKYCVQDVEVERAIDRALPDLTPGEQEIWFLDQKINSRGVYVDTECVYSAIQLADHFDEKMNIEINELTGGQVTAITQASALLSWVRKNGLPYIDDLTKGSVATWLENPDIPLPVRRALELRQNAKTSVAKYKAFADSTAPDNRIRDILMYHGASTGRWTGKNVQFQNLAKGDLKSMGHTMETAIDLLRERDTDEIVRCSNNRPADFLSACLRGMIIAPEGHDMYVADFNAIEARVIYWCANYDKGLELFATGGDPYRAMASKIFNVPIKSIAKDSMERQLGKQVILGCGFQLGPQKFHATCLAYGINIEMELAEKAVRAYREEHQEIKQLWYNSESAAIQATLNRGSAYKAGRVHYVADDEFLYCVLPSKRRLCYYHPQVITAMAPWGKEVPKLTFMAVNSVTRKWEKEVTYGGKCVENYIQGIARDLMASGMLNLENAGYQVALSVHDEAISYREENSGSIEEYCGLLEKIPTWADDKPYVDDFGNSHVWRACPVKAEGWKGKRYRK